MTRGQGYVGLVADDERVVNLVGIVLGSEGARVGGHRSALE